MWIPHNSTRTTSRDNSSFNSELRGSRDYVGIAFSVFFVPLGDPVDPYFHRKIKTISHEPSLHKVPMIR
jgi:hypothetical protein